MILDFSVTDDILKRKSLSTPMDQDTSYYKCHFYLKKEIWDNSTISITFFYNEKHVKTMTLGPYEEILTCIIPNNIVSAGYCSFYLSSDDDRKTNTVHLTFTDHYEKPKQKCNPIQQIFNVLDQKIDNIVYENGQLKCYSNNVLKDVIYLANVDQDSVIYLVEQELENHSFADVAFSGSFDDLNDVPKTFKPSIHTHWLDQITDFDSTINEIFDQMIIKFNSR